MLQHIWTSRSRLKRGGGIAPQSLDASAPGLGEIAAADAPQLETMFDREWALRLIQAAFARVESEFAAAGRADEFAILRRFLPGVEKPLRYDEAARLLGRTEGVVKSAIHRLRDSYRIALRSLVARTVSAAHEVDDELSYLHTVLTVPPRDAA